MELNILNQYFSDGTFTSILLVGVAILLYYIAKWNSLANFPPGPWGIPIFGYLPFLSKEPHKDFQQLAKKYGDIFSVQVGPSHVVILNTHEAIKKAFVKTDAFDGRPQSGIGTKIIGKGVGMADGKLWKTQRRFLLSSMRDFGLGKSNMEEFIQTEIEAAVERLHETKGQPYDISNITQIIACNVIAYFIFGQRFSIKDKAVQHALIHTSKAVDELNFMSNLNVFIEILKYIPDQISGMKYLLNLRKQVTDFVDSIILQHKITYDDNDTRDLIDLYLKKMQQNGNGPDNIFTSELLQDNTVNLFLAGTHTTDLMMCWILRLLAAYPNVQKKMQTELDQVIGRERLPSMKDKPDLIYTEAVILEMHRYVTLVPMTIYHKISEDVMLDGYKIPKNTNCLANIWNVHNSRETWDDPDKFNPERFLDKSGRLKPNLVESVIPFSIGKRNCVGEAIARMEIFLQVTILCQKFFFTLPQGEVWKFQPSKFIPVQSTETNMICATPRS